MADWEKDFTFGNDNVAAMAVGSPESWVGQTVNLSVVHNGNEGSIALAAYDQDGAMLGQAVATPGNGVTISFTGSGGNVGAVAQLTGGAAGQSATFRIGPRTEDGSPPQPVPLQGDAWPALPGSPDLKPLIPWINWLHPYWPFWPDPVNNDDPDPRRGSDH